MALLSCRWTSLGWLTCELLRGCSSKGRGADIDALVLNAGAQFPNLDQRTEDGSETTFAVNHLAHYLLLRFLLPKLGEQLA
jgi:NAD(P)-dependent dehydrogenase (short-subunit alcohol dehydrogenase family)